MASATRSSSRTFLLCRIGHSHFAATPRRLPHLSLLHSWLLETKTVTGYVPSIATERSRWITTAVRLPVRQSADCGKYHTSDRCNYLVWLIVTTPITLCPRYIANTVCNKHGKGLQNDPVFGALN